MVNRDSQERKARTIRMNATEDAAFKLAAQSTNLDVNSWMRLALRRVASEQLESAGLPNPLKAPVDTNKKHR